MENLDEQIETLTKLMASLDIPSETNEEIDVALDYSSDENPYENPFEYQGKDIDEKIQNWSNRLGAQIQLSEELRALQPRDLLNFITHKTSRNVYRYIESINELELSRIATTDAMTTFKNVVASIVQEFTGRIPGAESSSNEAFREQAYWRIIILKICDMCYLDSFIYEFSDQYYKLDPTRQKSALEMFFNKLPESLSTKIKNMYAAIIQKGNTIHDTLGARITTIKAWITKECLQETAKKEAQVKLFCERQSNKIGNYGCSKKTYKKRKKIWKRKIYNPKYKTFYKKNSRPN
ncbi:coat protein [Artemisia annua]|uniref:Coat protein n=1 Tax=Artemisia annua TaxID=35608 RepID=A0A2U1LNJ6_ARTAN|nr:coat protein [Artemisia annua]